MNFWLYRNICIVYDKYIALKDIEADSYDLSILDKSLFLTPKTCEESLKALSSSPYGVEQLCSIYFNLFSDKEIDTFSIDKLDFDTLPIGTILDKRLVSKIDRFRVFLGKALNIRKIINRGKREAIKFIKSFFTPEIGILDTFFSSGLLLTLSFKSFFKIQEIGFEKIPKIENYKLDKEGREKIFQWEEYFDDFDKYFFESMESLMPFSFIEGFQEIYAFSRKNNNNLTYVISEAWLGNEFLSIKLAIMQQDGIRHIHPQHGWVHFNFLTLMWLESYLSDVYLTSGAQIKGLPNIVQGGYIRESYSVIKDNSRADILFFSTTSPAYTYQLDENVRDMSFSIYLDKQVKFIELLKEDLFNELFYRKYPVDYGWGEVDTLTKKFPKLKFDNVQKRGLDRLSSAKLVIFDGFSTGYIESIIANTPTVIIFDKDIRCVNKEFEKLIDKLFKVNVVFYNIEDAAHHINSVYMNPYEWWNLEKVQREIKVFLDCTARDRKYSENYILQLIK